jgi:two-component system OmpR family response regulator
MRILVVEDDRQVACQIESALRQSGYVVDVAHDGEEGRFLGDTEPYDAVVLDLGLPLLDGLSVLQRWRQDGRKMPVLILTARDTWREKVFGLRAGADDYLAKPFEMEEMLARVEALIRRAAGHADAVLDWGPVKLDTATHRVTLRGGPVELTPLEFRMLSYMMHHGDKVISKTELSEHIYGHDFDLDSNTIEVLVSRLRKKLGPALIRTHRGRGYQLALQEDAP